MSISLRGWPSKGRLGKIVLLVICFSFILASVASADLFLKFEDIIGGSKAKGHEGWSYILDVSWGVSVPVISPFSDGGGTVTPVFDNLSWNMVADRSVTQLFTLVTTGKHIFDAYVDFTTPLNDQNFTYFQMHFRDVLLSSLKVKGDSKSSTTNIAGSFAYNFIEMTYTELMVDGSPGPSFTASYDLKKNIGFSSLQAETDSLGPLVALFALGNSGPIILSPVPIPASLLLFSSGLMGLIGLRRQFRR